MLKHPNAALEGEICEFCLWKDCKVQTFGTCFWTFASSLYL